MSCTATEILDCELAGCPDHNRETGLWIDSIRRWSSRGSTPEQIAADLKLPVEMVLPHVVTDHELRVEQETARKLRSEMVAFLNGNFTQVEIAGFLGIGLPAVCYHLQRHKDDGPNPERNEERRERPSG